MEPRKADWDFWGKAQQARAWECLALSLDLEPRDLGLDHFLVLRSCESGNSLLSDTDPEWLGAMCTRLEKLLKTLVDAPAGLRAGKAKPVSIDAELKLAGFAAWLKDKRLKQPKDLAARLPADPKPIAAATKDAEKPLVNAPAASKSAAKKANAKVASKKVSPKAAAVSSKSSKAAKPAARH